MKPNSRMENDVDKLVERIASELPEQVPPDRVWEHIADEMERSRQTHNDETARSRPLPGWSMSLMLRPRIRYALYVVAIVMGLSASVLLMYQPGGVNLPIGITGNEPSEDVLFDAQQDIDQAIRYYESAISKLTVLAERNIPNLDPDFVALQKERITVLRESIDECKQALEKNKLHPEVQFYLLTAYNDLQGTLQEMINKTN